MPSGRRPARTRTDFILAGITFADEHGTDALTLKALGAAMGTATTGLYRYFRDKQDLIIAMREHLLGNVLHRSDLTITDAHDRLVASAMAYRAAVQEHPCLGQILLLPAGEGRHSAEVTDVIVAALVDLGFTGTALARAYQQLESFVVGSTIFDFSQAPGHLTMRRARLQRAANEDVRRALADAASIEANNEAAFRSSLEVLVAGLQREAQDIQRAEPAQQPS